MIAQLSWPMLSGHLNRMRGVFEGWLPAHRNTFNFMLDRLNTVDISCFVIPPPKQHIEGKVLLLVLLAIRCLDQLQLGRFPVLGLGRVLH